MPREMLRAWTPNSENIHSSYKLSYNTEPEMLKASDGLKQDLAEYATRLVLTNPARQHHLGFLFPRNKGESSGYTLVEISEPVQITPPRENPAILRADVYVLDSQTRKVHPKALKIIKRAGLIKI
jgi:hypothetical protein